MRRVLAPIAVFFCLVAPAYAGEDLTVPAYQIQAYCPKRPKPNSFGTGFVVKDPRSSGAVLMTALHVIYECERISIADPNCDGTGGTIAKASVEPKTAIDAWPDHDLAAIHLKPDQETLLRQGKPLRSLVPAPGTSVKVLAPPRRGTQLAIYGPSEDNPCLDNVGFALHAVRVSALFAQLRARSIHLSPGSLLEDAWLILYFASVAPGTSGGPAIIESDRGEPRIIGVHNGGTADGKVAWAISTSQVDWASAREFKFGDAWPPFKPADLSNSLEVGGPTPEQFASALSPDVQGFIRRKDDRSFLFSAEASYEIALAGKPGFYWNALAELGFFTELKSWPKVSSYNSVGVHGAVGATVGQFHQTFSAPDGTIVQQADQPQYGAVAEVDLQFRFRRIFHNRPSFDVGIRGGFVNFTDYTGMNTRYGGRFGIPIRGRLSMSKTTFVALSLIWGLVVEYAPLPAYRYTGIGAMISDTNPYSWALSANIGVGFEY